MDPRRADLWEDAPAARAVLEADSKRRMELARQEALEARNTPFVPRDWSAKPAEQAPAPEKSWWQVWKGGKRSRRSRRKRTRRTRKN